MATVRVAPQAAADLARLTRMLSLPASTRERVRESILVLERFPRIGSELEGRWSEFRFVLGPWRWMLIVYAFDEAADTAVVVTIQDARSGGAATAEGS